MGSFIGERIGRYVICRQLGRGGMGEVFEASHEDIGHRAVVKVLSAELARDPKHLDYVERFQREAQAVNVVQDPGLVHIFDFGQLRDGTVYIMMEYLDGELLWDRMERLRQSGTRMRPPAALRVVRQLATSLAAAHECNIIHRDLKPENVMLVKDPEVAGGERTKLLDFGIAKFLDSPQRLTTAGMVLGTAIYMSPEQCQGAEKLDGKSDVYSLGVMLYELLTGSPPFDGEPGKVMRAHVFEPPPPLAGCHPGLPEAVYRLVDALLSKEPQGRPRARDVAALIRQIEEMGGLPEGDPLQAGAKPKATRARTARTQLVTARREQGGVFLSWPLLASGLAATVLSTLAVAWAVGTGQGAPVAPLHPPPPAPPGACVPAAAAPPPAAALGGGKEDPQGQPAEKPTRGKQARKRKQRARNEENSIPRD